VDARSGQVLSAQGADTPRYPASLTKLMTLDLAFQALRDGRMTMDTQIPISAHASAVEPVKLGLPPGATLSVHDAILAMTTMSANDAATAMGEYLGGGSEARCAQMMTLRAHALGMAQTQFYNTSGLPNPGQVTTARDLSLLARDIVMNFPEDQQFFEVQSFPFRGRTIYSNNGMLKSYSGATGMKTGYTNLARHNLITSAQRNGRTLIGVVLHEPSWGSTYVQMTAMLDSGFGGHVPVRSTQQIAAAQPQRPAAPVQQAASRQPHAPAPIAMASNKAHPTAVGGWVAQLGVYTRMAKARTAALAAREMRGTGVARIAKVEKNGHTMWSAQLAGLTSNAARATCSALSARGTACHVVPPSADHLAMLTGEDGT
jgi:D-alanyl-D-alanine carboxypeptidase